MDILVSMVEQILKSVPALVMTIECPQRLFGPDLLMKYLPLILKISRGTHPSNSTRRHPTLMIHCREISKIRACRQKKEFVRQHSEGYNARLDQLCDSQLDFGGRSMTSFGRDIAGSFRETLSPALALVSLQNLRNEFRHEVHSARNKQQVRWQWLKLKKFC